MGWIYCGWKRTEEDDVESFVIRSPMLSKLCDVVEEKFFQPLASSISLGFSCGVYRGAVITSKHIQEKSLYKAWQWIYNNTIWFKSFSIFLLILKLVRSFTIYSSDFIIEPARIYIAKRITSYWRISLRIYLPWGSRD